MGNYVQKAFDSLRQVRSDLVVELDQIDTALAAFEGANSTPKRSRSLKPCCTKQEVTEIVARLLCDNPVLSRDKIESLAKEKARNELGKSLSGFAMRLKEALADPLFTELEPGDFRLSRKNEQLGVEP